jgi:hypothetical protein
MIKECKYCGKIVLRNPIKGCCSIEHSQLWKRAYNADYYRQKNEIVLTEKYSNMLRVCMRQFGENVAFEAEILNCMGFDWGFSIKQVEMHKQLYNIMGEFAYTGFTVNKMNKIKIIRHE